MTWARAEAVLAARTCESVMTGSKPVARAAACAAVSVIVATGSKPVAVATQTSALTVREYAGVGAGE